MINLIDGLFEFQENCVSFLLDKTADDQSKQTIIVKSPTGSGKTIILIDFIDKYLDHVNPKTCFVWLCPGDGDLEEQSQDKMEDLLPNRVTRDINDVLLQGFVEGSTTFINWQKVTKKGNKAITDSERSNLFERIADAHRSGIQFIVIIDEEHRNNTSKAKDIIDAFSSKNIIRVSATTKEDKLSEWYEIDDFTKGIDIRVKYNNKWYNIALLQSTTRSLFFKNKKKNRHPGMNADLIYVELNQAHSKRCGDYNLYTLYNVEQLKQELEKK
jgi:type III restriction enzyme